MAFGKRQPVFFLGRAHRQDLGPRFDKMSKADWADLFCDLYCQCFGESESTPEMMMQDAEKRLEILKRNGVR